MATAAQFPQNALHRGLTARHVVIAPDEQEEFNTLQNSLIEEPNPQGAIEKQALTMVELETRTMMANYMRRAEAARQKPAA